MILTLLFVCMCVFVYVCVFFFLQTYERLFRAVEQREGGMLQLLGDQTPPKHQHTHTQALTHTQLQHTNQLSLTQTNLHTPNWDMFSPIPANHTDSSVEQAATNRSSLIDTTYSQRGSGSPSPLRSMTPDPQLPVVTDASILNLTSLSRYVCSMRTYVTGAGIFSPCHGHFSFF